MVKRRRLPRQRQPRAIERAYARDLRALVTKLKKPVARVLAELAVMERERRVDSWRVDKDPERNATEVTTVLKGMKAQFDTVVKRARPGLIAQGVGKRTSAFAMNAADDVVRGAVTIPATKVASKKTLDAFTKENAKLIKSISDTLHDQVADVIEESWLKGRRVEDIADKVKERFGVADSRAALIARTEVSKLSSQVTRDRHKQIGITSYRWRTSLDERVRGNPSGLYPDADPSHWDREGKVFDFDDPPEGGHAGETYNCRCSAEPVIPDLEDE